jgi:hypothetical protein
MTTLTQKFTGLETQLTAEQTALLTALAPLSTLHADIAAVSTAVTALNTALGTELASIFDLLDTMNNNNAGNAQAILAAIAFYACCDAAGTPAIPPAAGTGAGSTTGSAKCQRIQYFVDLFRFGWGLAMEAYTSIVGSMSRAAAASVLAQALSDRSISTGQLALGVPSSTKIQIADAFAALITDEGLATGMSDLSAMMGDNTFWLTVVKAVYLQSTSIAGLSAWRSAIAGAAYPETVRAVANAMLYSAWTNDIYGAVPVVDASAYDGGICLTALHNLTACAVFTTAVVARGGHNYQALVLPAAYGPDAQYTAGDYFGWTYQVLTGQFGKGLGTYYYPLTGGVTFLRQDSAGADPRSIDVHTNAITFFSIDFAETITQPFTVRICPPGSS